MSIAVYLPPASLPLSLSLTVVSLEQVNLFAEGHTHTHTLEKLPLSAAWGSIAASLCLKSFVFW